MVRRVAGEAAMAPPECVPKLLPCHIRLAEAYVPYQVYTIAFSPAEALCAGTVFPDLYRPYAACGEGGVSPWR